MLNLSQLSSSLFKLGSLLDEFRVEYYVMI